MLLIPHVHLLNILKWSSQTAKLRTSFRSNNRTDRQTAFYLHKTILDSLPEKLVCLNYTHMHLQMLISSINNFLFVTASLDH
jgi:hypothetical protein